MYRIKKYDKKILFECFFRYSLGAIHLLLLLNNNYLYFVSCFSTEYAMKTIKCSAFLIKD